MVRKSIVFILSIFLIIILSSCNHSQTTKTTKELTITTSHKDFSWFSSLDNYNILLEIYEVNKNHYLVRNNDENGESKIKYMDNDGNIEWEKDQVPLVSSGILKTNQGFIFSYEQEQEWKLIYLNYDGHKIWEKSGDMFQQNNAVGYTYESTDNTYVHTVIDDSGQELFSMSNQEHSIDIWKIGDHYLLKNFNGVNGLSIVDSTGNVIKVFNPSYSVITTNYGGNILIKEMTYNTDFKYIVIDNNGKVKYQTSEYRDAIIIKSDSKNLYIRAGIENNRLYKLDTKLKVNWEIGPFPNVISYKIIDNYLVFSSDIQTIYKYDLFGNKIMEYPLEHGNRPFYIMKEYTIYKEQDGDNFYVINNQLKEVFNFQEANRMIKFKADESGIIYTYYRDDKYIIKKIDMEGHTMWEEEDLYNPVITQLEDGKTLIIDWNWSQEISTHQHIYIISQNGKMIYNKNLIGISHDYSDPTYYKFTFYAGNSTDGVDELKFKPITMEELLYLFYY